MTLEDPKEYYLTLQVSFSANEDDIKASYRRLARELHPDKNMADDAKEQFQKLAEAYSGELNSSLRSRQKRTLRPVWGRRRGRRRLCRIFRRTFYRHSNRHV